jgi:nitrite reductase/ring-hydroxylating ferredoxin subunit
VLQSQKIIQSHNNNYVMFGDERFFLLRLYQKAYIIPDKCPHRGGPLSLGIKCLINGTIQCPWHDSLIKASVLIKRSRPVVRIYNEVFYT